MSRKRFWTVGGTGSGALSDARLWGLLGVVLVGCTMPPGGEPTGGAGGAPSGNPSVFVVRSRDDGAAGSLRDILTRVNARRRTSGISIELPDGEYVLTACGADDSNAAGDLDITTDAPITLVGQSGDAADVIVRQTCAGERVLDALGDGTLTLRALTLTGGALVAVGGETARGGGVRASADVVLEITAVIGNAAHGDPGFTRLGTTDVPLPAAQGGGLYVAGALTSRGSVITENAAASVAAGSGTGSVDRRPGGIVEGGGAYVVGPLTMRAGAVSSNHATATYSSSARGGGVAAGSAQVTLSDVTFTDNDAEGGYDDVFGVGSAEGGALAAEGPVTANRVLALRNRAEGGERDPALGAFTLSGAGRGGALAIRGAARIESSDFLDNRAESGNAASDCRQTVFCERYARRAGPALGGAVWGVGEIALVDCGFDGNRTEQGDGLAPEVPSRGGAVAGDAGITVQGGDYTNNYGEGRGGALSGRNVSIAHAVFTGNTGQRPEGGGDIPPELGGGGAIDAATLTAERVTASGNRVSGIGGGALLVSGDATLRACRISGNTADYNRAAPAPVQGRGAGAYVAGRVTAIDSTFSANEGRAVPAAYHSLCRLDLRRCAAAFAGGGLWASSVDGRNLTVASNSTMGVTVSENAESHPTGGAAIAASGEVALVNATLTENVITELLYYDVTFGPSRGSAVFAGALRLDHATVVDNRTQRIAMDGTPIGTPRPALDAASFVTFRSAAVGEYLESTVCAPGTHTGSSADSAYNLFSDDSCGLTGVGDEQGLQPIFQPLTDNGGLVPTRAPIPGYGCIDIIPPAACPIATDARGVTRPQAAACDIGAVELAQ